MIRDFFAALTRNTMSLVGTAMAAASILLIITLIIIEQLGFRGGAYLGILTYLILPMFLLVGLILIPIGVARERRRIREAAAHGEKIPEFLVIDFNKPRTRRFVLLFAVFGAVGVVILAGATYKGVELMDSNAFCGTVCHTVMQPEYTAYHRSPHARVKCGDCHIGPGAEWFVKSKLSGAWQVIAVAFDLYPRPIPTPVHDLRPARDTCEQCHWPEKFVGDKLKVVTHFAEDEANTELTTALLLRVGGIRGRDSHGIHWHVDPNIQVRYRADASRETIYDVELTEPDGTVKVFKNGETPEDAMPWRVMDCVDCHNRPTHIYRLPETEIDLAIEKGGIDPSLPFVRRESNRILRAEYASHEEAREGITSELEAFYRENYPDVVAEQAEAIAEAGQVLGDIYASNIFPAMNVNWGTYPDHIGHEQSPGCFRCHNRKHKTEGGERISRRCSICHSVLAQEEENPEILSQLEP